MATQLLLTLLLDRVAIVLQRLAGMQVFLFKGADLLVLVLQSQFEIGQGLVQAGVARLLRLQQGAGFLQGFGFLGQCQALKFVLLLQFSVVVFCFGQLGFQVFALLLELLAGLIDRFLRLLLEPLRQSRDQCQQLIVNRR
ncbi:hypothetical protein D3C84_472350 [compost metagenome]